MDLRQFNLLSDAQLKAELTKCQYCEEQPCSKACPAGLSPADFIMAARGGEDRDMARSAALMYEQNPFAAVCGSVCPDTFCMAACSFETFNTPVNIPKVQSTIATRAGLAGRKPEPERKSSLGVKAAVVGAGPAGMTMALSLSLKGYDVRVFEKGSQPGGMIRYIPEERLHSDVLEADLAFVQGMSGVTVEYGRRIEKPEDLLQEGYSAVAVATGLDLPMKLGIEGADHCLTWEEWLRNADTMQVEGKTVGIIGGGAVAMDCAMTALHRGAAVSEMICLEKPSEMVLDSQERMEFMASGLQVQGRTRVVSVREDDGRLRAHLRRVSLPQGKEFSPVLMEDVPTSDSSGLYDILVFAIGSRASMTMIDIPGIFYAGDLEHGPSTVVEAVAGAKNTVARIVAYLHNAEHDAVQNARKSALSVGEFGKTPVDLSTDFFGRRIPSPFLLSAAPPSDGYDQMKKAYEAGWSGGVMKTAFDGLDIHIPGEYMFVLDEKTFGNADNVSDHPLDRVCGEIGRLVREYPDRLTMASTGGPVTGDDQADRKVWQNNTRKLEAAGVMGIEYSLSCPQGGDGTKGDIVSQDPELTAKIIDWVLETAEPDIPKIFKLTGAVTALYPILDAIRTVFNKYPEKKAGITLANSFPGLGFRKGGESVWDEGVIIGLSGEGITPISNLSLANASAFDLNISGNGGPMDYRAAADFLALGAKTVQFCSMVMKYGYRIIDEIHSGVSHLMADLGFSSMEELIGAALPSPVTGFMDLSPVKKISSLKPELCVSCGNCTHCPYLAITLDDSKLPVIDASRCIGCSFCTKTCFAGALEMRERTAEETAMLSE